MGLINRKPKLEQRVPPAQNAPTEKVQVKAHFLQFFPQDVRAEYEKFHTWALAVAQSNHNDNSFANLQTLLANPAGNSPFKGGVVPIRRIAEGLDHAIYLAIVCGKDGAVLPLAGGAEFIAKIYRGGGSPEKAAKAHWIDTLLPLITRSLGVNTFVYSYSTMLADGKLLSVMEKVTGGTLKALKGTISISKYDPQLISVVKMLDTSSLTDADKDELRQLVINLDVQQLQDQLLADMLFSYNDGHWQQYMIDFETDLTKPQGQRFFNARLRKVDNTDYFYIKDRVDRRPEPYVTKNGTTKPQRLAATCVLAGLPNANKLLTTATLHKVSKWSYFDLASQLDALTFQVEVESSPGSRITKTSIQPLLTSDEKALVAQNFFRLRALLVEAEQAPGGMTARELFDRFISLTGPNGAPIPHPDLTVIDSVLNGKPNLQSAFSRYNLLPKYCDITNEVAVGNSYVGLQQADDQVRTQMQASRTADAAAIKTALATLRRS